MSKLLIKSLGMFNPSISPDGTKVLGGNGKLQYIDLTNLKTIPVTIPNAGFLRGGWAANSVIYIENESDGLIYTWINGVTDISFRGNYRSNDFRVSSFNFAACLYGHSLNYNDTQLGLFNYSIDLYGDRLVANRAEGVSRVRVWRAGVFFNDYIPLTPPNVVRASIGDYFSYGYFGPSALIKSDGTQVLVNLVQNETPCKVILDSNGIPWIITAANTECYLRPLGHTEKTAIILKSGAVRLDAWSDGTKVIVACDLTDGSCSIFEASFSEALVPIETPVPVPNPMIVPAVTVDKWTLTTMDDGGEFIFHDRNNPTEAYRCRVYIQGGSIYAEMTNAKGTAKTGTFRPVQKCNNPPPTPLPPIPPGPAVDATIALNGKYFKRETGERMTVIEDSNFSLFKKYLNNDLMVDTVLAQRSTVGFNTLRVWLLNQSVVGIAPGQYPDFYSKLTTFVDYLATKKFCVELTIFTQTKTLMPNQADQQKHLDSTANAVRGRKNVILELVNESDQYDNACSPNLTRPTGVIISHGSNGADHDGVVPMWDYDIYHSNSLSEFQRKVGHNAMEFADLHNVPCLSNENTRYPDNDSSENHAYDAAAGAALLCAGSCFHSNAGKNSILYDDTELRCAKQWVAGALSVPLEYQPGVYARHDELNGPNVIRAYTRTLSDGRRHLVLIRP